MKATADLSYLLAAGHNKAAANKFQATLEMSIHDMTPEVVCGGRKVVSAQFC